MSWRERWRAVKGSLVGQVVGAVLLTGLALLAAMYLLAAFYDGSSAPSTDSGRPAMYELVRSSAAIAALIGGAVAIVVALRRQRATEATYELDALRAGRERLDRFRDRYATIAGQLGADSPAVRLAGVYALAALADDWLEEDNAAEAQVCVDVLTSYLRTPRPEHDATASGADREVRRAIFDVITTHLRWGVARRSWSNLRFTFDGVAFDQPVAFYGAEFNGGCRVAFNGAEFNDGCRVAFNGAKFNDGCRVSFNGAKFNDGCRVSFNGAEFNDGCLVWFDGAEFNDGCLVWFDGAEFNDGCWVRFNGAKFNDGSKVPGPWPGSTPPASWPNPRMS